MLAKQYTHRLPADYEMGRIRARAASRGPVWDTTENLAFKGFVAQVRGEFGATRNAYASIYLWRDSSGAADFLMGERFAAVTESFGRPSIETWLPLHARKGSATNARSFYREDVELPDNADRQAMCAAELRRADTVASQPGIVAAVTALDTRDWRFIRLILSEDEPDASRPGTAYQVFYLAKPGLAALR